MAHSTAPKYSKLVTLKDSTTYGYFSIPAKPGQPTLLFLHGYPSSSYHWHKQIDPCISAGYGMIAPDLLGYGDTDKPKEIAAYDNTIISQHVIEILDLEKISRVVAVGHDWGAILLSTTMRLYPDRFSQIIWVTTSYVPTQAFFQDIEAVDRKNIEVHGRNLMGYWAFHNKPEAVSIFENSEPGSFESLLYADGQVWKDNVCPPGAIERYLKASVRSKIPSWVQQSEFEHHTSILRTGGFTGPLNWYKQAHAGFTHSSEAKINPDYASTKFEIPALFIGCEKDVVSLAKPQVDRLKMFFRDLTIEMVDAGHWPQLERPEEMWKILSTWIEAKTKG